MRAKYKRSDFATLERGEFFREVAKGISVAVLDPKQADETAPPATQGDALGSVSPGLRPFRPSS